MDVKLTPEQAIEILINYNPIVEYNAHAQEDQIINGMNNFQAKKIADLIQSQQQEIAKLKESERIKNIVDGDVSLPNWEAERKTGVVK